VIGSIAIAQLRATIYFDMCNHHATIRSADRDVRRVTSNTVCHLTRTSKETVKKRTEENIWATDYEDYKERTTMLRNRYDRVDYSFSFSTMYINSTLAILVLVSSDCMFY